MTSKFSVSFSHSPESEMPNVRMKLDSKFSEDESKMENMSVFVRIRPMLKKEEDAGYKECIAAVDDKVVRAIVPKSSYKFKNSNNAGQEIIEDFKYSQAFGPETGQFVFFEQTIMNTMENYIAGGNCLIFSYGITNSGKTYTLQGNDENPGIIILALKLFFASIEHQLFNHTYLKPDRFSDYIRLNDSERSQETQLKEDLFKNYNQIINKSGDSSANLTKSFAMMLCECFSDSYKMKENETTWAPEDMEAAQSAAYMKDMCKKVANEQWGKCNVWISFIEIYNEFIYDLLNSDVLKCSERKILQLAEDKNGDVYVKGAKEICVADVDEALKLLHLGRRNLKIACTKLNYQSSRSHCIYIMKVVRFDEDLSEVRVNRLAFCDLAGSERANKSEASGLRLREASHINSSLLVLGRCLEQLRLNQNLRDKKLIPFRESKLTRFFSNHFTGKGKAVMIANASPCEYTFDETLNVLRFSALAKELLLNDSYMKMASNSLQNITDQWAQTRARVSTSFSLDQSSDMESSLLEDIQAKDEMIEKLLDLADSLRANLETEKKQKAQLEYVIRQDVCREYSEYSDELLAKQKSAYEEQMEELKAIYKKQLNDLEKLKNDRIKGLMEEIAEYEASSDDSFNKSELRKSSLSHVDCPDVLDDEKDVDLITFNEKSNGRTSNEPKLLISQLEKYEEENKVLKLDLCSLKNQLEISMIEVQNNVTHIADLKNELQEYKDQALTMNTGSENSTFIKCDHLSEIEKLTSDLVSLREDLDFVTSERNAFQEQLEQTSSLLKDSQTNESATQDKCIDLDSKLQEALQILEQYEEEIMILKSAVSEAENKFVGESNVKLELQNTIFTLSEELDKIKSDTEKNDLENMASQLTEQKNKVVEIEKEKVLAENKCAEILDKNAALEEIINNLKNSLNEAECKASELNSKLEKMNKTVEEHKSRVFALESECDVYRNESSKSFAKSKTLEEEIGIMSQSLESVKNEKDAIKKTGDNVINSLKSDLAEIEKKYQELKLNFDETNDVVKEHETACIALKEENETMKTNNEILAEKLIAKEEIEKNLIKEEEERKLSYIRMCDEASVLLGSEKSKVALLESESLGLKTDIKKLKDENENLKNQIENLIKEEEERKSNYIGIENEDSALLGSEKSKVELLESESLVLKTDIKRLTDENGNLKNQMEKLTKENEQREMDAIEMTDKISELLKEKSKVTTLELECFSLKTDLKKLSDENEILKKQTMNTLKGEDVMESTKNISGIGSDYEKLEEFNTSKNEFTNNIELDKSYISEKELDFEENESNDFKSSLQKLAEKEKECECLVAKYDAISADHFILENEYKKLMEQIEGDVKNIEALKNEKESAENALSKLKTDYDEAVENLKRMNGVENKLLEMSNVVEENRSELSRFQEQQSAFEEEIKALEKNNKILEEKFLNSSNKLDAAQTEAMKLKKKLEDIETEKQSSSEKNMSEIEVLRENNNKLLENHASLKERFDEISNKNENTILRIKELEKQNSDLELNCSAFKEKNEKLTANMEELENHISSLTEKLDELTNQLKASQISESTALEKIKTLSASLTSYSDNIKDMERQISEKEANIQVLEEAIGKLQDQMKEANSDNEKKIFALKQQHEIEVTEIMHVKSIVENENSKLKTENTKFKRRANTAAEDKKVTKKKSAVSKVENSDEKENSDVNSELNKKLKRSSSITSEEGEKTESKKTRRALRPRQPEVQFSDDSDSDSKSTKSHSRKRKSSCEFVPPKRTLRNKASKKTSKNEKVLRTKKEDKDENMSPVQKMAAFVGTAMSRVAQTVSSIPSPRMTRGRRKLFNVDAAPSTPSSKNWRY